MLYEEFQQIKFFGSNIYFPVLVAGRVAGEINLNITESHNIGYGAFPASA